MPIKFCSNAYFFQAWGSLTSLKSQTRDLRLKVPPGGLVLRTFTSWKIHRPQPDLKPRTLDFEASTLPRDHRGRQSLYKDNIINDGTLFIWKLKINVNIMKCIVILFISNEIYTCSKYFMLVCTHVIESWPRHSTPSPHQCFNLVSWAQLV